MLTGLFDLSKPQEPLLQEYLLSDIISDLCERERMNLVARAITVRSCPDKIREMVKGYEDLNALIFATLLAIFKISSADASDTCSPSQIEEFVWRYTYAHPGFRILCGKEENPDFVPGPEHLSEVKENIHELTKFIILDVLRNGGEPNIGRSWDFEKKKFREYSLRLLEEKQNGGYILTEVACDYIFHTFEIPSGVHYSLQMLCLKQQLKYDNYSDAEKSSARLIEDMVTLQRVIQEFIERINQNFTNIKSGEYKAKIDVISETVNTAQEKSEELMTLASLKSIQMQKAMDEGERSDEVQQAYRSLQKVIANINRAAVEITKLQNLRIKAGERFDELIAEGFAYHEIQRVNIKSEIIQPLGKMDLDYREAIAYIALNMLSIPKPTRTASIDTVFNPFNMQKEAAVTSGVDLAVPEDKQADKEKEALRYRNSIMRKFYIFLNYVADHKKFRLKELMEELSEQDRELLLRKRFIISLTTHLYTYHSYENISDATANESTENSAPMGELDEMFCLQTAKREHPELVGFSGIKVTKVKGTEIRFTYEEDSMEKRLTANDFLYEVIDCG